MLAITVIWLCLCVTANLILITAYDRKKQNSSKKRFMLSCMAPFMLGGMSPYLIFSIRNGESLGILLFVFAAINVAVSVVYCIFIKKINL